MRKYGTKQSHVLPIWNGILESKHREKIGPAIWEFLWCIDKITKEVDGVGWLLGRAPIKLERIAAELSEDYHTAKRNLNRLEEMGYIVRVRTPYGFSIGVCKSNKFGAWSESTDSAKTPNLSPEGDGAKMPSHSPAATGQKCTERVGKNAPRDSAKMPKTKKTSQETTQRATQKVKTSRFGRGGGNHHHRLNTSVPNTDDDGRRPPFQTSTPEPEVQTTIERAKVELINRGEDPATVAKVLDRAQIRHAQFVKEGKAQQEIFSPMYWLAVYDNTSSEEREKARFYVACDLVLLHPYLPGAFSQAIAEHAQRSGRKVPEIAQELLTENLKYPAVVAEVQRLAGGVLQG